MTAAQVPEFSTPESLHGAVRVAHREYIGDISTGVAGGSDFFRTYQITPLNPQLFPWLSVMAQNFQQWIACGIVMEFVSTCGNAFSGTSAALGDVNMVCEYDLEAPPLTTKAQMLNSFYATSAATSQNLMMAVECAPEDNTVNVRYLQQPGVSLFYDTRLNALGNIFLRNTGSQSSYVAGQLWVTYEIILLKPRVFVPPTVAKRFTGSQVVALGAAAESRGKPLTSAQFQLLCELPETQEEKEHSPTFDDVLDQLVLEGALRPEIPNPSSQTGERKPQVARSEPIDIPVGGPPVDDCPSW